MNVASGQLPQIRVIVRPVTEDDMEAIAAIFGHYVTSSVITFEETPSDETQWQSRREDLARLGLPFVVADVAGAVVGYAYASTWRPKPAADKEHRSTASDEASI